MKHIHSTAYDFMVYIFLYNKYNQLQDSTPHLFSCLSSCNHPLLCFYEVCLKPSNFLIVSSVIFFLYMISSITCCFRGSLKDSMHMGLSTQKIIPLYFIRCLIRVYLILLIFITISTTGSFIFLTLNKVTKIVF